MNRHRVRRATLFEMSVSDLVATYRSGAITFDELCDHCRRHRYHETKKSLQHLYADGQLSKDELQYILGELLRTHLHASF